MGRKMVSKWNNEMKKAGIWELRQESKASTEFPQENMILVSARRGRVSMKTACRFILEILQLDHSLVAMGGSKSKCGKGPQTKMLLLYAPLCFKSFLALLSSSFWKPTNQSMVAGTPCLRTILDGRRFAIVPLLYHSHATVVAQSYHCRVRSLITTVLLLLCHSHTTVLWYSLTTVHSYCATAIPLYHDIILPQSAPVVPQSSLGQL